MLQEQAPTWLCPICNNSAPFETLAVDEYVKDILAKTPKSLEQVTIEPDGNWTTKTEAESQPNGNTGFASDGDDDIIEIVDPKVNSLRKASTPATGTSATPTPAPAGPSSVASVTPIPARPANKRSIDAVTIDLTASDDDEEPIRGPPKRQQTSFSGPSGIDGLSPYAPNVSTNGAYYGNTYYGAGTR
jgi:E3 SUMO-protein ligase PIAS1